MATDASQNFIDYWTKYICQNFSTKNSYELTVSPPKLLTSKEVRYCLMDLKENLNRFIVNQGRDRTKGAWILFPEFADGRIHFHGYLKTYMPWGLLMDQRKQISMDYIVNVDKIKSQNSYINYVLKDVSETKKLILEMRPIKSDDISPIPKKWFHDLFSKEELFDVAESLTSSCYCKACYPDRAEHINY